MYHLDMSKPRLSFALSMALFLALMAIAPSASAQTSAGSISALTGSLTVDRGGKSVPASQGSALLVGDKRTTGPDSHVTINLGDGSQIELSDSSTLVLTENVLNPNGSRASTKITLLTGLVRSLVKVSASGTPNFEVHTPNAVASARGTMFDVSYHQDRPPSATP